MTTQKEAQTALMIAAHAIAKNNPANIAYRAKISEAIKRVHLATRIQMEMEGEAYTYFDILEEVATEAIKEEREKAAKKAVSPKQKIQEYKAMLMRGYDAYSKYATISREADELVSNVQVLGKGLAADIATTVYRYKRCSEKQAYRIAEAIVTQSLA